MKGACAQPRSAYLPRTRRSVDESIGGVILIPNSMEYEQDDFVSVMPSSDTEAQVRVTCPDKTGLGADITRTIFDFGLVTVKGDFATDGKWAFVLVIVKKQTGMGGAAVNWDLLRMRLENQCPSKASISTLSSLNLAVRLGSVQHEQKYALKSV